MKNASDGELMSGIAQGNQSAFRELYRRYSAHVLGYSRRMMRNPSTADEVSQECWIKIVRAAATYRAEGSVKSWLYTVVRRTALNFMRDQLPRETLTDSENAPEATTQEFEASVLARAEISKVRAALADLPDNQRLALTMWLTEELSYEEIARELNLSEGAVKQLLFRARQTLAERIRRGA